MAQLQQIVRYADRLLRVDRIADYPDAMNGLQLENGGRVTRIAAAVDAAGYTIRAAIAAKADLLIVHHGLFWGPKRPVRGIWYRRLAEAMGGGLAIYSAHLPLDVHPEIGNSMLLARAIGMRAPKPFFDLMGSPVGVRGRMNLGRDELGRRLEKALGGKVHRCPHGPERAGEVAIVSGGAGGEVEKVHALGIETFITGEGPHWSYLLARDLGMNLFYGGHYATETFGVKALAEKLSARFRVPWVFLDEPTGL